MNKRVTCFERYLESPLRPITMMALSIFAAIGSGCVELNPNPDQGPLDRGGDDPDPVGDTASGPTIPDVKFDPDCTATITWIQPEDTAQFIDQSVEITVAVSDAIPDDAAIIELFDAQNIRVPGATHLSADGTTLTFTPHAPLAPNHFHRVHATVCDDLQKSGFTTLGDPINLEVIEGQSWGLPFDEVTWLAPIGGGILLDPLLDDGELIIGAFNVDPYTDTLSIVASWTDTCTEVIVEEVSVAANPWMEVGPFDLEIDVGLGVVAAQDVLISAVVAPDGETLEFLEATATLDSRGIDPLLGLTLCDVSAALGTPCTACPDTEPYCLPLFLQADSVGLASTSAGQDCPL